MRTFLGVLVTALFVATACETGAGPSGSAKSVTTPEAAAAAVVARTPLFDGIGPLDREMIGQAAWWEATADPAVNGFAVTYRVGWGDCQAGCIDNHTWSWVVARDGTVAFVSEAGSPLTDDILVGLYAGATRTGVGGRVRAGPVCPVERPGEPGCEPRAVAGASLVVRDTDGADVASFTTDASGLYRIDLAPGDYTLEGMAVEGLMGAPTPMPFTVRDRALTVLDVAYETGIR